MEGERIRYSSAASPALAPPPIQSHNKQGPLHIYIWAGLGTATVLVGAMLFFCVKRIFRQLRWTRKGLLESEKIEVRRFQLEELEKATKHFCKDCLVGSGAFGNVYKGTFYAEGTLAIKKARTNSYQNVQEFRNEVKLLSRVKHRNLVSLVGYCEAGEKLLVYEYVPNGSLLEYIVGRRGRTLTWRQRVNIAIGAAKGIAHLHEGVKPSIIHRDIKPSNILIGDGLEAKVSDFGLVKLGPVGDDSHVTSQIKGTPGYVDPAYCSSFHLSPFSDVYSFGVILLQLVAARPAVDKSRNHSHYHIIEWARPSLERGNVEDILDVNLLMEPCNTKMMLIMAQLGLRCVVKIPKERPTMTQVWQELEEALYSTNNFIHKQLSRGTCDSIEHESSQSFVSVNGIGLERFYVEMDSLSFQSTSLRCLDIDSIIINVDNNSLGGISEESSSDEEASLTRG